MTKHWRTKAITIPQSEARENITGNKFKLIQEGK